MADLTAPVEAALRQAQEHLAHARATVPALAPADPQVVAGAAHALNNSLTLLVGTVDLLRRALADHPQRDIPTWLDGVRHGAILMTHTVRQMMGTASPQWPALRWERVAVPLLVQRLCDAYRPRAATKGQQLVWSAAATVPLVTTDGVVVGAILDNLVSNAVTYAPRGGRIWVHVQGEGQSVVCRVHDDGPGIRPEEQPRLFQRGVRLSPHPMGGEPARGYGLAVAKELAAQVGADLWCVSTPGQGARFALRLPAAPEASTAGTAPAGA